MADSALDYAETRYSEMHPDEALAYVCIECGSEWRSMPAEFCVAGLVHNGWQSGYCEDCQNVLAELHDAERYGTSRREEYERECEMIERGVNPWQ